MPILPSFFLSLLVLQLNISYRRITRFWKKKSLNHFCIIFNLNSKFHIFIFKFCIKWPKFTVSLVLCIYIWDLNGRTRRRDILSTPGWVSAWLGGNWRGVYTHTKLNCHSFHRVPTWTCANLKLKISSAK